MYLVFWNGVHASTDVNLTWRFIWLTVIKKKNTKKNLINIFLLFRNKILKTLFMSCMFLVH